LCEKHVGTPACEVAATGANRDFAPNPLIVTLTPVAGVASAEPLSAPAEAAPAEPAPQ